MGKRTFTIWLRFLFLPSQLFSCTKKKTYQRQYDTHFSSFFFFYFIYLLLSQRTQRTWFSSVTLCVSDKMFFVSRTSTTRRKMVHILEEPRICYESHACDSKWRRRKKQKNTWRPINHHATFLSVFICLVTSHLFAVIHTQRVHAFHFLFVVSRLVISLASFERTMYYEREIFVVFVVLNKFLGIRKIVLFLFIEMWHCLLSRHKVEFIAAKTRSIKLNTNICVFRFSSL